MPRIVDMVESKYIKKEEVGAGVLATIKGITQHDVSLANESPKLKYCLEFEENTPPLDKPLVLNLTKMSVLEEMTGSDDSDDWIGKKIVIYHNPEIMFGPKKTGGTAIRAPKNQSQPEPVDRQAVEVDDLPF